MNVKCFIRLTTGWGQCKKVSFFWAGDWRSPGLVVMGDDSCSKGHMFESRRCILDGHLDIFHIEKRPGLAHFKKESFFSGQWL